MNRRRVFVLGAGFSQPAKIPLANGLLPLLAEKVGLDEMRAWLEGLRERVEWLSAGDHKRCSVVRRILAQCCRLFRRPKMDREGQPRPLNIEEVFHCAHFDVEVQRLQQQLARVGRYDGPATPWNHGESIESWLWHLENALRDVVLECDDAADLEPITRWAKGVDPSDVVVTFNYDTLVERALSSRGKPWNHGVGPCSEGEISVLKLHGSIDWIVADRCESFAKCDLLFDKENVNQSDERTGHVEDDRRLWRCQTREQLRNWIEDRDLQLLPNGTMPASVGIAGLGVYKEPHEIPGLGRVWAEAMRALHDGDVAVIVGFSMSDFDAMAQMQFAEVARRRQGQGQPLNVELIDPFINRDTKTRFFRVFRRVKFHRCYHERVDWSRF